MRRPRWSTCARALLYAVIAALLYHIVANLQSDRVVDDGRWEWFDVRRLTSFAEEPSGVSQLANRSWPCAAALREGQGRHLLCPLCACLCVCVVFSMLHDHLLILLVRRQVCDRSFTAGDKLRGPWRSGGRCCAVRVGCAPLPAYA
jgi:hypothetical protein